MLKAFHAGSGWWRRLAKMGTPNLASPQTDGQQLKKRSKLAISHLAIEVDQPRTSSPVHKNGLKPVFRSTAPQTPTSPGYVWIVPKRRADLIPRAKEAPMHWSELFGIACWPRSITAASSGPWSMISHFTWALPLISRAPAHRRQISPTSVAGIGCYALFETIEHGTPIPVTARQKARLSNPHT